MNTKSERPTRALDAALPQAPEGEQAEALHMLDVLSTAESGTRLHRYCMQWLTSHIKAQPRPSNAATRPVTITVDTLKSATRENQHNSATLLSMIRDDVIVGDYQRTLVGLLNDVLQSAFPDGVGVAGSGALLREYKKAASVIRTIAGMGHDSTDKEVAGEAERLARLWAVESAPTDAPQASSEDANVLRDMLACCQAWEPQVCILGNVRAGDAAKAIEAAIAAQQRKGEG